MEKQKSLPILMSFSGVDGAGKSTQIQALCDHIRGLGFTVRIIAFWDEVATFKRIRETTAHILFKGEKGVGSPDKPVVRKDKNVQTWPMGLVRYVLYLFDAVSLHRIVRRTLESGTDFVIFDRYTYDELVNLGLENRLPRLYSRLILKLIPKLDVSYLLDADPGQARARKPEYPVDFLFTCRERYLFLSTIVGGMAVIPALPIPEVKRRVLEHAVNHLSSAYLEPKAS